MAACGRAGNKYSDSTYRCLQIDLAYKPGEAQFVSGLNTLDLMVANSSLLSGRETDCDSDEVAECSVLNPAVAWQASNPYEAG